MADGTQVVKAKRGWRVVDRLTFPSDKPLWLYNTVVFPFAWLYAMYTKKNFRIKGDLRYLMSKEKKSVQYLVEFYCWLRKGIEWSELHYPEWAYMSIPDMKMHQILPSGSNYGYWSYRRFTKDPAHLFSDKESHYDFESEEVVFLPYARKSATEWVTTCPGDPVTEKMINKQIDETFIHPKFKCVDKIDWLPGSDSWDPEQPTDFVDVVSPFGPSVV